MSELLLCASAPLAIRQQLFKNKVKWPVMWKRRHKLLFSVEISYACYYYFWVQRRNRNKLRSKPECGLWAVFFWGKHMRDMWRDILCRGKGNSTVGQSCWFQRVGRGLGFCWSGTDGWLFPFWASFLREVSLTQWLSHNMGLCWFFWWVLLLDDCEKESNPGSI